jgi:hypothetical protein
MSAMTSTSAPVRRAGAFLGAALAASLALGGCNGDAAQSVQGDSPDSSQARGAGSLVEVSPLTGLPVGDDAPEHPIMIVKIDNTASAEPQLGLSGADLVVEELVEGGSTRFAAFYWQNRPDVVGPVRSMRATDIGIVQPAEAKLVAAGGAPKTRRRVAAAGIDLLEEDDPGFSRDDSRVAPYNLMVDLEVLADSLDEADPPGTYLPFGAENSWPGGKAAKTIEATFSGMHTTAWRFEDGTGWVRADSLAQQGEDFVPDNVLALRVQVGDAGYLDPAGNAVPELKVAGGGSATLFHDGEAIEGRWSKDGTEGAIELTDLDGEDLTVPVGKTWIELIPRGTGSLRFGG